jgi:hypothetical protein
MSASTLYAVADPNEERPLKNEGVFTGHVATRGYEWDVTIHAGSAQQAKEQIEDAYPLGVVGRIYPGRPQK